MRIFLLLAFLVLPAGWAGLQGQVLADGKPLKGCLCPPTIPVKAFRPDWSYLSDARERYDLLRSRDPLSGYQAKWNIKGGKLYLVAFDSFVLRSGLEYVINVDSPQGKGTQSVNVSRDDFMPVSIRDLYSTNRDCEDGIFAKWFTGSIKFGVGDIRANRFNSHGAEVTFDTEFELWFQGGVLQPMGMQRTAKSIPAAKILKTLK